MPGNPIESEPLKNFIEKFGKAGVVALLNPQDLGIRAKEKEEIVKGLPPDFESAIRGLGINELIRLGLAPADAVAICYEKSGCLEQPFSCADKKGWFAGPAREALESDDGAWHNLIKALEGGNQ